jgi:hypothetical protein
MENNKISVLHTIEDLKLTSGGPTRTVLGLVNALSKIDIDVFLATQNLLHEEYLSPKNIKIFETYAYKYSIFKKLGTSFKNGITYLIKKNNPITLDKIFFVWIVPHESYIKPFYSIFENIDTNLVTVDIYITKHNDNKILDDKYYSLFNIYYQKPKIEDCINTYISNNYIEDMSEICIFSCGSASITKELYKTCNKLNIDFYNENFT